MSHVLSAVRTALHGTPLPPASPTASGRQTLPPRTPAEVAKILALFPPDDSLKIN